MSRGLSVEASEFYKKHQRDIDAAVKRMIGIIVERLDPGACPHAVGQTIWGCVQSAIEAYFRSGQTAGIVVGKRISLMIAPHPQGVSVVFGHVLDSRVLRQGPRVKPSLRPNRKGVARRLSEAFASWTEKGSGTVSEIMISASDVAKLRADKPGAVVEGEIFGVPYKLVAEGEPLRVR